MIVIVDGRRDTSSGEKPNKPVKWTGNFVVADSSGNAIEAAWEPNGVPRMNYQGARNRASQLVASLTARLFEQHKQPIRKVAYTLTSR
ncbi:hypothetical protein KVG88_30080 [Pseudomonas sp. SWRI74]|jgi:hypothetical protein|uniref:Uncharacterized protein n=1 Tax=Pseudomonas azerbaijanoccidentalis TaxID=2842347 RepID=A0ABS6QZL8_9PSED|nr:hypothetical protein [Pseudomonas azerbaijanoccidentalis]MBV4524324.1 hypothetical protein [Pseudomonas azerbaijanoccidentalis]